MKPELKDPITMLAEYFSGGEVCHASIGLSVGGMPGRSAARFFAVRKAFGIEGYDSLQVCERKILKVVKDNT